MLSELRVVDVGIIEDLRVVFGGGLTAITGETGAGKTLVVEALELLAGARADSGLVRPGAPEARVEGRFEDPDRGEEVVLARVIPAEGRSRAYLNGRLATAAELAELAVRLVDLHGQHAHQTLLAPAAQRAALDAFAGVLAAAALDEYRGARAELHAIDTALGALGGDARARAREIALLAYQVEEIDSALLASPDEDSALEAEESALGDAAAHREALGSAYTAVEGGGLDAIGVAVAAVAGRPRFADLEERLRGLQAEVAEVAHDLRDAAEAVVEDPERLDGVRARRRLLRELERKYGDTLADVVTYREESAVRLGELEGHEQRVADLEAERQQTNLEMLDSAQRLHAVRVGAAGDLATAVEQRLRRLAMPGARLAVEVETGDTGEDGADRVTFLLAANPGEPAAPLARVVSGGELSRAMLALRVALAERGAGRGPTLVFDEVDAGIGGEAGAAVGRELAALGEDAQVLCITHLAQVAACADAQVVVRKQERADRTVASAELLQGEARVAELSRMLAGVGDSAHARRHAEELLAEGSGRAR